MKSILKKTIVIILLLVLALSLGLMAVGCEEKDSFFTEGYVNVEARYLGYNTPRYRFDYENISESTFDNVHITKDDYVNIIKYGCIFPKSGGSLMTYYSGRERNYLMEDISNIGDREITYFGGRKELGEGEILLHKWAYYQVMFDAHGVDVIFPNIMSQEGNTLPRLIYMYATNVALLRAYPLVIDKFGLASDYKDSQSTGGDFNDIEIRVARQDGSEAKRILRVVGYYTTGEEDYLLNTEFDMNEFSKPEYEQTENDREAVAKYISAPITEKEAELLAQYNRITLNAYYG